MHRQRMLQTTEESEKLDWGRINRQVVSGMSLSGDRRNRHEKIAKAEMRNADGRVLKKRRHLPEGKIQIRPSGTIKVKQWLLIDRSRDNTCEEKCRESESMTSTSGTNKKRKNGREIEQGKNGREMW